MMQESLAEKLRVLRAQRGLSLLAASKQLGIDRHTLRRVELGTQDPQYPTLAKIAEGYGVPVEELLEEPALARKAEARLPLGPAPGEDGARLIDPKVLARWRAAVMDARRFREVGKDLMDEQLAAWRKSTGPEESARARRRMAELLNQAEGATMTLMDRRPVYMTPEAPRAFEEAKKAGACQVPDADWEEISEADRFYSRLWGMVEGQQGLSIRKGPERNTIEVLDEAA